MIHVGQVRVGQDHIRLQSPAIGKDDPARLVPVHIYPLNRCFEFELNSGLARNRHQRLDHLVHASLRIPGAMRQLRVRHHGKSSRSLERT